MHPVPSNANWLKITITSPRCDATTPPAVTISRFLTLRPPMPLTSINLGGLCLKITQTSFPARPPLAPLSMSDPLVEETVFEML